MAQTFNRDMVIIMELKVPQQQYIAILANIGVIWEDWHVCRQTVWNSESILNWAKEVYCVEYALRDLR